MGNAFCRRCRRTRESPARQSAAAHQSAEASAPLLGAIFVTDDTCTAWPGEDGLGAANYSEPVARLSASRDKPRKYKPSTDEAEPLGRRLPASVDDALLPALLRLLCAPEVGRALPALLCARWRDWAQPRSAEIFELWRQHARRHARRSLAACLAAAPAATNLALSELRGVRRCLDSIIPVSADALKFGSPGELREAAVWWGRIVDASAGCELFFVRGPQCENSTWRPLWESVRIFRYRCSEKADFSQFRVGHCFQELTRVNIIWWSGKDGPTIIQLVIMYLEHSVVVGLKEESSMDCIDASWFLALQRIASQHMRHLTAGPS